MTTEEKESQEPWAGEKVYPHPGVKLTTHIAILLGCIIGIVLGVLLRMYAVQFCEWLYDIALTSSVNNFRNLGLGMVIAFSACFVGYLIEIFMGYSTKEIALSQEGIVLRRQKRNSIVIQSITNVKEGSRGRVLKLTGLTPEGKTIKRRLLRAEVGRKRWQEFKQDLQKIQSGD